MNSLTFCAPFLLALAFGAWLVLEDARRARHPRSRPFDHERDQQDSRRS